MDETIANDITVAKLLAECVKEDSLTAEIMAVIDEEQYIIEFIDALELIRVLDGTEETS